MKRQNLFGRRSKFSGFPTRRQDGFFARGGRQLRLEPLEERALLSAIPNWIPQGPTPITNGQAENIPSTGPGANPVVGAIHDIATHPANANVAYLGTVNGGVWRSTDFTSANPTYTPLTDHFSGTSIGALEFDPTDATNNTLYAGIGHASSLGRRGAPLTGLLRTTDGGNTWTQLGGANLAGRNITGLVARGNTIVVSANSFGGGVGAGVYRSTNGGGTFNFISGTNGLGIGAAFDLVGDPTNLNRMYVSVGGVGIFFSGNQGATWANVSAGDASLNANITAAGNNNLEMAVSPTTGRIYASVLTNGRLFYMGFSDNQGGTWTEMDLPVTSDAEGIFSTSPQENPGGQGSIHFSIVVDPTTATTVYIGGDRQPDDFGGGGGANSLGALDYSGRLFRGDTTVAPNNPGGKALADVGSPQWEHLTHTQNLVFAGGGTANNSSPHADSRDMAFRADGVLVEVSDGGIYGRTNPQNNTGDWFSLISDAGGGLQITEIHDIAYDNNSDVLMSGHQDTGSAQQPIAGSLTWTSIPRIPAPIGSFGVPAAFSTADGGDVVVDNLIGGGQSLRYFSTQNLNSFRRQVYNAAGAFVSQATPTLIGPAITGQFVTPLAVNEVAANRLVIGGDNGVFESLNRGDNVALVNPAPVFAPPLPPVAGGFTRFPTVISSLDYGAAGNAEFLYAGFSVIDRAPGAATFQTAGVFGRSAAGLMTQRTAPAGAFILNDIEMDSTNGNTVYTVDSNQVWESLDGGNNWTEITGNLSDNNLQSLQYVENPGGANVILVGGEGGVFRTSVDNLGIWSEFGIGLPNSIVYDMDYDVADDILVVGTLGRGAWAIEDASATIFDFQEVEPNNTQATATILGSLPKITLRDQSIEGALDVDFFKYTAQDTGKLIVNMFFDATADNLDLRVRDVNGNIIATGTQSNIVAGLDIEGVVAPVVTQEEYWIEVSTTLPNVTMYDLEIENFPAPIPDFVDLPAKDQSEVLNDTGWSQFDDVTSRTEPEIIIEADLFDFALEGVTILTAAQASAGNTPGAAVEVFVNGNSVGFANPIAGTGNTLFRFTFTAGQLPATVFHGDSGGWLHYVKAAVRMFDGQQNAGGNPAPQSARTQLSQPLRLVVDNAVPASPSAPDLLATSDSGASDSDNVTNVNPPAFQGTGEHNDKIRIYANGVLVGEGFVGSDLTDGGFDQIGRWEVTIEPLADGTYDITAEVEDLAGNISEPSEALVGLVIDTIDGSGQPERPTIDLLDADDTGMSATDNNTRLDVLRFRVTADPGTTVDVKDGNTVIDTFVMPVAGEAVRTYNFVTLVGTTGFPAEGPHPLSAESTDLAGNRGPQAEELLVTIDQTAPTVDVPDMLASSDSGLFSNDEVTNINAPAFDGFVRLQAPEAGVKVFLFANGKQIGQTDLLIDFQDNTFQYEITSEPLDDGIYGVAATVQDLAGNFSGSLSLPIWIDTVAPNTPYLDLVDASDSGRSNQDNVTNVNQPTVTVTADDTVSGDGNPFWHEIQYRIYDRPDLVGNNGEVLLVDSLVTNPGLSTNGFFTETLNTLADGVTAYTLPDAVHNLKLEVEDRAGNISHDFLLPVTIDTVAPPVSIVGIDPATSDTGVEGQPATFADNITSDTATGFVGTAEADAIVRMWADGAPITAGAINGSDVFQGLTVAVPLDGNLAFPNGQWNLAGQFDLNDPTVGFPFDGRRQIIVTAEDLAGNESSRVAPDAVAILDIFIDTQGPQIFDPDGVGPEQAIQITGSPNYNLFGLKPDNAPEGPTPLVNSLTINVRDLPFRDAPDFLYVALAKGAGDNPAENPGHYLVVGDANGIIPITNVIVTNAAPVDGAQATATIELQFAAPLPDDRFTLTIKDDVVDPAGNNFDGESNAIEPNGSPNFPTGDGVPGGDFVARFTVDSRPEIGVWSAGSVYVDTNGNFHFDPTNVDYTNRDITYLMGFASDDIFAGNFALLPGDTADGFDKLAAYGHNTAGRYRWLVDTDNDGVADITRLEPAGFDGLGTPVAGNFDGIAANGDEVGLFTGSSWLLDTDHDFRVSDEVPLDAGLVGYPIVGDFDGDGNDDLATYLSGTFSFDLFANGGLGVEPVVPTITLNFLQFIGTRERPVAADMNQDGIDDLGLWVPDRSGAVPEAGGEWYFLISTPTFANPVANPAGEVDWLDHDFSPVPFGNDLFAQFGDEYAAPIVGNFDPPVAGSTVPAPDTLTLEGTEGDDTVEVTIDGPGQWTVELNGIGLNVGREVVAVEFDGLGGKDSVIVNGSAGDEKVELWPGHGTLSGEGYTVAIAGSEVITVRGGGGTDTAVLHDNPDGKDSFRAFPEVARLYGDGYFNQVSSFRYVHAMSTNGNEDTAGLFGDPNSDDVFKAWPDQARLYSESFYNKAINFRYVTAFGTEGNKDIAVLANDPNGDDVFKAWPDEAKLYSDSFYHRAVNFRYVSAVGTEGNEDTAVLFDDPNGADVLKAWPDEAKLYGADFFNRALSFRYVHAVGTEGNKDTATLFDSVGSDTFQAWPDEAKLSGDRFFNRALSFGSVHAYSMAGGADVAQLYGSAGNDRFVAKSHFSRLSGDGFLNRAVSFNQVHAYGGDGDDLAVLYDAVLEAGLTQQPVPADIASIVWLYDIETIRERSEAGGGTSKTDAVDTIMTAYWQ